MAALSVFIVVKKQNKTKQKKKNDSSYVNAAVRENTVLIQNLTQIDENMPKYRFYFVPGTNHCVIHLLYYVLYLFKSQSLIKETNK